MVKLAVGVKKGTMINRKGPVINNYQGKDEKNFPAISQSHAHKGRNLREPSSQSLGGVQPGFGIS